MWVEAQSPLPRGSKQQSEQNEKQAIFCFNLFFFLIKNWEVLLLAMYVYFTKMRNTN